MFITYAQNFEDVMLWRALKTVVDGFYVDIGANDPVVDSVSKAFYDRGWRGLHVEPVTHFAQKIRANRPDEIVVEKAVGAQPGQMLLHVIPDTGLSSLVPEVAKKAVDLRGYAVKPMEVEVVTLADLLGTYDGRDIHWLKIDVEGAEADVLRGWDPRRHRPWIMLVEATAPNSQVETHAEWEEILFGADYIHAWFDGLSRFYVAKERAHLLESFRTPPNVFDEFVSAQLVERHDRMAIAEQRVAQLEAQLSELEGKDWFVVARQSVQALDDHHAAEAAVARLGRRLQEIEASLAEGPGKRFRELEEARRLADAGRQAAEQRVQMMQSSTSWRVTAPLRKVKTAFRVARTQPGMLGTLIAHNLRLFKPAPRPSLIAAEKFQSAVKVSPLVIDDPAIPPLTEQARDELQQCHAGTSNTSLDEITALGQVRAAGDSFCFVIDAVGSPHQLDRSIQSVLRQTDPSWELLLVSRPGAGDYLRHWLDTDWRIRHVEARADDLTTIAEAATATFLVSLRCGDAVDDDYVRLTLQCLRMQGETVDLLYCDEARVSQSGGIGDFFFKPDWSPEHLQSVNYIGRGYAIRKTLALRLPLPEASTRDVRDYELVLAASAQARKIAHVDQSLYVGDGHRCPIGGFFGDADLEEARHALETHLRRQSEGYRVESDPRLGTLDVRGPNPPATTTLTILTGLSRRELPGIGETLLVDHFVRSIIARTRPGRWKILVVDDGELPAETLELLERHGHRRVSFRREGPFSFAEKANFAIRNADDGVVILLNDDLEVISPDWVERLSEIADRPQVGVVGAQLYYADGTIQHAGMVLGFNGSVGQIFHKSGEAGDYAGFMKITRNYSAVTGAVMAMRKSVFEALGGFDVKLAVDYNDVDFCLRCLKNGLRVVHSSHVHLFHFHNSSLKRKHDDRTERDLFVQRWSTEIGRDQYYNRHLQLVSGELPVLSECAGTVAAPERLDRDGRKKDYAALKSRLAQEAEKTLSSPGWEYAVRGLSGGLLAQAKSIMENGLFDREFYLHIYPDVRAAEIDPLLHYLQSGDAEGRFPNAAFDPRFYRSQFKGDGIGAAGALLHYLEHGEAAGLSASALFNGGRYKSGNPDLTDWLDRPLTHYLHIGRNEGLSANRKMRLPSGFCVNVRRCEEPGQVDGAGLRRAINVIGPLDRVAGLGVSARGYLEAAEKSGFGPVGVRAQTREFSIQKSLPGVRDFPDFIPDAAINLFHMNGDTLPMFLESGGKALLKKRYNVAIWYWELATLRPEWVAVMKNFHEFWAPTPFIARALSRSTNKPVRLVPPYLSYLKTMPAAHEHQGPPNFLYCFDANSILERKNPVVLLEAFQRAFPKAEGRDVRLTFKITYPNRAIEDVDRLYRGADADSRIQIVDRILSEEDLQCLMSGATAYLSPHRSEGLGLTVIEAMACGVPVIATPYGGVEAFVTAEDAWPIRSQLVELPAEYMPYPKGFVWADPNVGSLAEAMLDVARDPAAAKRRTNVARRRVLDIFASDALLETYRQEFVRIGSLLFSKDGAESR